MSTLGVRENLCAVLDRIRGAAAAAGREPETVRLVAVTKTVPGAAVRAAYDAGQRAFGENRLQEMRGKASALPSDCEWHMIGHLQQNKVRLAVQQAAWIHSVDTVTLIERIDRIAAEEGRRPVVLLQVNIFGEATKSGVDPRAAAALVAAARLCRHLECRGMMTMAPYGAHPEELRRGFRALRELRDGLAVTGGLALPELSMGMSGDFDIAIAEGATLVRIGTAIFGPRPPADGMGMCPDPGAVGG